MAPRGSCVRSFDSRSVTLPQRSLPWRFLRQDPESVSLPSRGFVGGSKRSRQLLGEAAASFVCGFNHVIGSASVGELQDQLSAVPADRRGFAYEGAGMACATLDILTSSRGRRVAALLEGPGDNYTHLIHVGTDCKSAGLRRLDCQRASRRARSRGPIS
jgi:enediyne biosynthesis protein E3